MDLDSMNVNSADNKTLLLQYLQLLNAQSSNVVNANLNTVPTVALATPASQPQQLPPRQQQRPAPAQSLSSTSASEMELFPFILHGLLDDAAKAQQTDIISWTPQGRSFCIYDADAFVRRFLPVYFPTVVVEANNNSGNGTTTTTLITSFISRLIGSWGFSLEAGSGFMFFHPFFQRDDIALLKFMRCSTGTSSCTISETKFGSPATDAAAMSNTIVPSTAPRHQQVQPSGSDLVSILLQQLLSSREAAASGVADVRSDTIINGTSNPYVSIPPSAAPREDAEQQQQPSPSIPAKGVKKHSVSNAKKATPALRKKKESEKLSFLKKRSASIKLTPPANKKQKISVNGTGNGTTLSSTMTIKKTIPVTGQLSSSSSSPPSKSIAAVPVPPFSFVLNEDFRQGKEDLPCQLFPWKIHDMLDDIERAANNGQPTNAGVVSWKSDGTSFVVRDQERFVQLVLPAYFQHEIKTWDEFTKTLAHWGFVQFTSGPQEGSFFHRLLVKGKRSLCKQMRINGKTVSESMKQHDQFLLRLHALLSYAEKDDANKSIVSWSLDGKKIVVHDSSAFVDLSLVYFDSMTFGSFEQKLRRWGFVRTPSCLPLDKDSKISHITYSHPLFIKSREPRVTWVSSCAGNLSISTVRPEASFLVRLRVMLNDCSRNGYQYAVSWLSHGKSFIVYDRVFFTEKILPLYFKGKFNSFRQSLRSHGFGQMGATNCWDEGAHYHKMFVRDSPMLCQGVTTEQMKKSMPEWIPAKDEPNFYGDDSSLSLPSSEQADIAAVIVSMKGTSR